MNLTHSQKILITLYELAEGTTGKIRFEDIAVKAYLKFKSDFQLKGYPQYPDTGDIIHKPLYSELKKGGLVLSGNKYFSLTEKGVSYAEKLLDTTIPGRTGPGFIKLTADQQKELDRLKTSAALDLFRQNKKDEILDIDFYSYLGVTVRTDKNLFLGRLLTVEDAIRATKDKSDKLYSLLRKCHVYLLKRFESNIQFVKNSKGGKR